MKKSITIKELSKMLDVSISTVSKALNDSHEISLATKERIQEAAKLYNYKPNRIAVNLKSGRTNTIGVIIPSVQNFFMTQVLRGIESVFADTPYNVIISITNESYDKEVQFMNTLTQGFVDGIIMAVSEETFIKKEYEHFTSFDKNKALLMFDRVVNAVDCDKVLVDDQASVFDATQKLIASGRKQIVLTTTISNLSVGKQRINGYTKAISTLHEPVLISDTEEHIESRVKQLLDEGKVDAVVALDQEATLASFRAGKSKKVLDNKAVAIVGYTSQIIAENLTPSLTTIDQNGVRIGELAAELLLKKLKKPLKDSESVVVNSTYQKRFTS
jgi:LacI family transcriptional regulator